MQHFCHHLYGSYIGTTTTKLSFLLVGSSDGSLLIVVDLF
jgi:hypothetical protein